MIMKQIGLVTLFCLFFTECSAKQIVDSLYVRFFSWEEYKQPHIITCTNFEHELPYTEFCISDQTMINKFLAATKELSITSDTDFCVGCKIFFMHDSQVIKKACLNSQHMLIDGKTYLCTKDLINIVDSMMHNGVLVDTQKMFLSDRYGDEYIHGREALLAKLETYLAKKLPETIKRCGDSRIVVHCKSDKKGKTTKVEPQIYNDRLSDVQKKYIISLVTKFFIRKVRWKSDDTRMSSDWITIMCKFKSTGYPEQI